MFWRFSYSASQLQTLLEKEEIIEEDDVLQECKSNNEKLIEFLINEKNLQQLVSYVISVPSDDISENIKFKYATISCELLTCDIPAINDALIKNHELVDKMYSFLYNQSPLNPLLASYFAKVIGSLISRKTEPFLNYIQSKEDFVDLFLKHINTSAIMDILLRLLTTIDSAEMRSRVLDWLKNIKIIEKLVELFGHEYSNLVQSNASQVLCDIIRISREQLLSLNESSLPINSLAINQQNDFDTMKSEDNEKNLNKIEELNIFPTNPLLESIESSERINRILELIFESVGKSNCSIIYGIEVLLTIMDFKYLTIYDNYDNQNEELIKAKRKREFDLIALKGIKTVISCCTVKLQSINTYLNELEPKIKSLTLTSGKEFKLLGKERLYVIKLLAKLFCFNSIDFTNEIMKLEIINRLMDYMIEYKSNNFLHTQITSIFKNIFSSENLFGTEINEVQTDVKQILIHHLITDCKILTKIIEIWKNYFDEKENMTEEKKKEANLGYLGHLTIISNLIWETYINENTRKYFDELFSKDATILENWKSLYETKITEINNRNQKELVRNPYAIQVIDSDKESNDFLNNDESNKKYLEFQREMKINCLDNFSLSEDHIISYQPKYPDLFNKIQGGISFQNDSNDDNANLFEQVCSQRDNMCLASEQSNLILDEEIWISKEIKYSESENNNNNDTLGNISKKKDHLMDVSEDENKEAEKLAENSLNEILQATVEKNSVSAIKRETDVEDQEINSSSSSSSSDDSIEDNSNDFIKSSEENKVPFSLEKIDSEEMKNDWSEFTDFSKIDDNNTDSQTKLFAADPWAAKFDSDTITSVTPVAAVAATPTANSSDEPENSNKITENWANFDNQ